MAYGKGKTCDLAFDTGVFRSTAKIYLDVAQRLEESCKNLDSLVDELKRTGWTTETAKFFYEEIAKENWVKNIIKYVDLLRTLSTVLNAVADDYDKLILEDVCNTQIGKEQSKG